MKESDLNNRKFTSKSLKLLKEYYLYNKNIFDEYQSKINKSGNTEYPIMKLVDMHFWQIGYEKDVLKN